MADRYFSPTNFVLKNKIAVLVFVFIVAVFGTIAYFNVPKEDNPDIKVPYIFISTVYPGVSAQDIETLVTKPIEKNLKAISNVKKVTSSSSESYSSIFMEFDPSVDVDNALQKVRDKVNQSKKDLPADAKDTLVQEFSFERMPVMILTFSGPYNLEQLKNSAKRLQDQIDTISGVLDTEIVGGLEREVNVLIDAAKLNFYGLTLSDVTNSLSAGNLNIPGGYMTIGDEKYLLRVPGEFQSAEEIGHISISGANGNVIHVSDVARVVDGFKDQSSLSRYEKQKSVSMIVRRRAGENIIELSNSVHQMVADSKKVLPADLKIAVIGDRSENIRSMLEELDNTIITGMVLVVLVLMFFMGVRNSLFVGIAIPVSIFITLVILYFSGVTLNMVVLFSLILALGRLVDDGIVIVENIYRHLEEGFPIAEATKLGAGEVAWPVITSTLTTLGAFFPLLFWPGIVGGFMKYLPITVIISLSASLFVALFVSPVLCALMMKLKRGDRQRSEKKESRVIQVYEKILRSLLQDESNRLSWAKRILSHTAIFVAVIVYMILIGAGSTGIEYAFSLSFKDHVIKILDFFGPALFLSSIGVSIIVYIYVSAVKPESDRRWLRGLAIWNLLLLFVISVPFLDMKTGYIRLFAGVLFLIPLVSWTRGFSRYDASFIKRGLAIHSFVFMFFGSIMSIHGVDVVFFPRITPEQVSIVVETPDGTTLQKTDEIVRRVEAIVEKEAERPTSNIRNYVTNVGLAGSDPFSSGAGATNKAEIAIEFYKQPDRKVIAKRNQVPEKLLSPFLTVDAFRESIKGISGGKIYVNEAQAGPPTGKPISVQISGPELDVLNRYSEKLKKMVVSTDGAVNVEDSLTRGNPELRIQIDREKANMYGLNVMSIASTVRAAVNGTKVSTLRNADDDIDIVVKLEDAQRNDVNTLQYLSIPGKEGARIPLSAVTKVDNQSGVGSISRIDFKRTVQVTGEVSKVSGRTANAINADIKNKLESPEFRLPDGYIYEFSGEQKDQQESMKFLSQAFLATLFLIGLILISEFNSIVLPSIIMFSVLLSFIGVILGLYLAPVFFKFSFKPDEFVIIMTGVGIVSLAGVVVNNAIVLMDYIKQLREDGVPKVEALVRAGKIRFRPVMLTAVTTELGLIPMSTGFSIDFVNRIYGVIPRIVTGGSSSEWWAPLANSVIFGLAVATILTLIMVPVFYYVLEDAPGKLWRLIRKR